MRLRRAVWLYVKSQWWLSGVRLWIDLVRDRKAKRLRLARLKRDVQTLQWRAAAEAERRLGDLILPHYSNPYNALAQHELNNLALQQQSLLQGVANSQPSDLLMNLLGQYRA